VKVLIVHARPEPSSFSGALMRTARNELLRLGHEVEVSDLHQRLRGAEPFVAHGPNRVSDDRRARDLEALRERMRGLGPA
jgi:putative NADPH-quinone reductase